jgi:hypothetical protein
MARVAAVVGSRPAAIIPTSVDVESPATFISYASVYRDGGAILDGDGGSW